MSIALMIDPQGDPDIIKAHEKFRKTLDTWIPIILAAQEPDGYLQTAFTAAAPRRGLLPPVPVTKPDGTVVLARVSVTQEPDGTLRDNRGGGRGGRGSEVRQLRKSRLTARRPQLYFSLWCNQDFTTSLHPHRPHGEPGPGLRRPRRRAECR